MPSLEYFLVAQDLAIDQFTNRVSLFNVLEEIQIPAAQNISAPLSCVAISAWNYNQADENVDNQVELSVSLPGVNDSVKSRVNFQMNKPRHRVFQRIDNLPCSAEGEIVFTVSLNGVQIARHTVIVARQS